MVLTRAYQQTKKKERGEEPAFLNTVTKNYLSIQSNLTNDWHFSIKVFITAWWFYINSCYFSIRCTCFFLTRSHMENQLFYQWSLLFHKNTFFVGFILPQFLCKGIVANTLKQCFCGTYNISNSIS